MAREARRFFSFLGTQSCRKPWNPYENECFRRAKRAGFLGVLGPLLGRESKNSLLENADRHFQIIIPPSDIKIQRWDSEDSGEFQITPPFI